ncbi:MAG TPA: histidine kinase [Bacteroidales bacterium]|nr:histidine kinase [Bacteroidales bacterium]
MILKMNKKGNKYFQVGMHLFFWLIVYLLPFVFFDKAISDFSHFLLYSWIPVIHYAIIFYVNFFVLINRFLFKKKYSVFIIINVLMVIAVLYSNWIIREVVFIDQIVKTQGGPPIGKPPPIIGFIIKDFISFCIPIMISIAIRAIEIWIKTDKEKQEIVNKNLESEILHLKYQLHPHFFFNLLNTIYVLIGKSPEKAQKTVHDLSKLMRYLLYDSNRGKVKLSMEIDFLMGYIELMNLRLPENVKVDYYFQKEQSENYQIFPLLLIPLIENSYKHGVFTTKDSIIKFYLVISNGKMIFKSSNSYFPKVQSEKSGSGIGLQNLKKRLELLYPDKYYYNFCIEDGCYSVILNIIL